MKSWKINSLQFSIFIWYFITSSLIGIGVNLITSIAEKDSYISIIISYIIGFIPILLFIYLFNKKIIITELTIKLFGKTIGTIINIITSLLLLLISSIYLVSLLLITLLEIFFTNKIPTTIKIIIQIITIIIINFFLFFPLLSKFIIT